MTHTPDTRSAEIHRRFESAREALGELDRLLLAYGQHTIESRRFIARGLAACDLSRKLGDAS